MGTYNKYAGAMMLRKQADFGREQFGEGRMDSDMQILMHPYRFEIGANMDEKL